MCFLLNKVILFLNDQIENFFFIIIFLRINKNKINNKKKSTHLYDYNYINLISSSPYISICIYKKCRYIRYFIITSIKISHVSSTSSHLTTKSITNATTISGDDDECFFFIIISLSLRLH